MPRGEIAAEGATFVNQNGYHHTKTGGKWVATHILIMEKKLGRPLEKGEFVKFEDGDRKNLDPDNLVLRTRGDRKSPQARLAEVEAKIEELQAEAEELRHLIASRESSHV
jgi:HNH endonuclease